MAEKKQETAGARAGEGSRAGGDAPRASEAARGGADTIEIDPLILSLERMYQVVTGSIAPPPSEEAYAPIPVERDPGEYVAERLERLLEAVVSPATPAGGPSQATLAASAPWTPALLVWESDRELVLQVELPGVRRQDVEVELDGDLLVVRGRRATLEDGARLRLTERPLGRFERRVQLPRRAERVEPSAKLADGVLEVRLGKPTGEGGGGRREIRVS
jgi:HSP20 family molecular chaperone IbpA